MPHNTSISLSDHFKDFISEEVESGRYQSASDVVRAGLRLLQERETQFKNLQNAIAKGLASPIDEEYDIETLLSKVKSKRDEAA